MTPGLPEIEIVKRLALAAVLGGIIGAERELRQKTAGFRTNILIAIGSALFTIMSVQLADSRSDPTRITAQVVTGVGFLCAGAIIRTRSGVHGLTTAATVWVNSSIGVACGGGAYRIAVIAGALTLAVLLLLAPAERAVERRVHRNARRNPPS
jgi:putative Mg2+ transporter-C (MgtC) family protein